MLSNLFFGYMPLKWKRLARVLSIILLPVTNFLFFTTITPLGNENDVLFWALVHIILVTIVSYTLKPFWVNEK